MFRFLNVVLIILVSSQILAQTAKMSITGTPQKLEFELTAVRDANGRYCAAVKVVSDMDGFKYDANNGVAKVDDNPGEDIVYLQPDERVLIIYHSGHEPMKIILSEIGIQLQPKEVWQIKLEGEAKAKDLLPVSILIKPSNSILEIDGKVIDSPPPYSLKKGEHSIKITKGGFRPFEKIITVDEKNVLFNISLEETEDIAVQIETVPAGAKVFIDGIEFGITPIAKFYPEGTYPIEISKTGYLTVKENIEIIPPRVNKSYTLLENAGYLQVNTYEGASVYLNGEIMDKNKEVKVSPMLAQIRVTMPKAKPLEKQVVIKKDEHVQLDMFPIAPLGTIQVAVTPFKASILLTGDAGEKFTASESNSFKNIPAGTYKLIVGKPGYKTHTETVILSENQKASRTIKLEKGADPKTYTSGTKKRYTRRAKRSWFGLQIGIGLAKERDLGDTELDNTAGIQYGLYYEKYMAKMLSLQMEMNLFNRKADYVYEYYDSYYGYTTETRISTETSILQLPVLFKINVPNTNNPLFSIYGGAGLNYYGTAKLKQDDLDDEVKIKRWELSYPVGISLKAGMFVFDFRYDYGSKFLNDNDDINATNDKSTRNDIFLIVALRF